jgi:hypothetical protein
MTMTKINDNGIDRDMTPDEKANYDAWVKVAQQEQAAAAAAKDAKAAALVSARTKLAALGLSDDEIAALLG